MKTNTEMVSGIDNLLRELNSSQRKAATFENRHALVLAGAGTGKTKTIIARAAYLIDSGVDPSRIKILTFTRRSASEIVSRVKVCLGNSAKGLEASTFHAWCMRLIRSAPDTFCTKGYSVIDRDDQLQLFKVLRGKKKKSEFPTAKALCDIYSFARNTGKRLSEITNFKLSEYDNIGDEVERIMRGYERKKNHNHYLDYDDILEIVAVQLYESDDIRQWLSSQYDHILIDETQDTNWSQWRLITPLKNKVTLFAVGDDAQSIYGFRGADFESIHKFSEHIQDSEILRLEENYRSTQEILDLPNWLLAKSPLKYEKTLKAVRGKGEKPQLYNFQDEWSEALWLTADLNQRHENGSSWSDHMILVRSAFTGRTIETTLIESGIPYQYIGGAKLLESSHVRNLLSVLRIIVNPRDEIAAMRYLTLWPMVGETKAVKFLGKMRKIQSLEALSTIFRQSEMLPDEASDALAIAIEKQNNVVEAIKGVYEQMENLLASHYQKQDWEKRKKDFPLIMKLAAKHDTIGEFIEDYLLDPVTGTQVEQGGGKDVVTIITIHSAKGTESLVCYVINVSPGYYPGHFATNESEVEEERRVLYVALTRAKNELIITRRGLSTWGSSKIKIESYFFNGLPVYLVNEFTYRSESFSMPKKQIRPPKGKKSLKFGLRF